MPQSLPQALQPLAAYRQFILCQLVPDESRPGKTHKYPLHPHTLHKHNPHDPAIWLTHDETAALCGSLGPGYMCGFVITHADPFFFIDVDNCLTPNGWSDESMRILGMVPGVAVYISQSGDGLHAIGSYTGSPPDHSCAPHGPELGLYTSGRFIALSGTDAVGDAAACPSMAQLVAEVFPPGNDVDAAGWTVTPVPEWGGAALDDDALINRACASGSAGGAFAGRANFADLWNANAEALGRTWPDGDQGRAWEATAADGALAGHLAFWTGKNCARIEALMMRPDCGLKRDKYERSDREAGTYLRRTILGAVARCSAVYGEKQALAQAERAQTATNLIAGSAPGLTFTAAAGGLIAATVANVESALLSDESGVTIAIDDFRKRLCILEGTRWRLFKDTDYGNLRAALEKRGFKPVPAEVIKTVVAMVADKRRFDSAHDRVAALEWDGTPRVTTALIKYYGVADSPYSRAASEYLFSALAGRSLAPGTKADMALILVGLQGARKTSAVEALALESDHFGAVDLSHLDDELGRKIRGKTVVEWAELRGLTGRDKESIKDWLSRRREEFRDLYCSFPEIYERRCIVLGTANEIEILDDPTGERRSLPMMAQDADVEGLLGVIEQLWAEGAHMFRNGGIRWQEAERLAKEEHPKFKVHDEWREAVVRWLHDLPSVAWGHIPGDTVNGDKPFGMLRVGKEALGLMPDKFSMGEQRRLGKLLRGLGYVKKDVRTGETIVKLWVRATGNTTGDKNIE